MTDRTELGGRTNLFTRTVLFARVNLSSLLGFIINLLTSTSTRATGTTGITDGVVISYAANEPSFNEGDLQNYDAGTNELLQSNNLDLSWTQRGTFSAVQDLVGADGEANTGWTLSGIDLATVGDVFQGVPGLVTATRYEPHFFFKQISASGLLSIVAPQSPVFGDWDIDLSLLTADFEIIDRDHPSVTINTEFQTGAGTATGFLMKKKSGTGTLSVGFSGAQIELGEISTPYIPTTTTAVTRDADITTVSVPSFVEQDGDWAFKFRGTPHETAQALKALFSFDSDATNYTEIQLNAANITANSVLLGVSNGAAVGLYSHTVDVQFETNVYYVASTKTLGIRSDDVSGDISAVAFIEDVLTSNPVITATLSIGNRNSLNQAVCDFDNDGVPVFYTSKEVAGW